MKGIRKLLPRRFGDAEMPFRLPRAGFRPSVTANPPPPPLPAGITLLEVLVTIFILSLGLLGVAALLPIGKLSLVETEKSDRTGMCGRAGLREVQVRRMLDPSTWSSSWDGPVAIDPLGVAHGLTMNIGGMRPLPPPLPIGPFPPPRYTFRWLLPVTPSTQTLADAVFRLQDELIFDNSSNAVGRPRGFVRDATGRMAPYPPLPSEPVLTQPWTPVTPPSGNFSWFITANPVGQGHYDVSVVVCHKRNFALDPSGQPEGEQAVDVTAFWGQGYGGGTLQLSAPISLKENQWVLLCGWNLVDINYPNPPPEYRRQLAMCRWYRVVGTGTNAQAMYISLHGPDWDTKFQVGRTDLGFPPTQTTLVAIDGVTGVYTTIVAVDTSCVWTK